MIASKSKRCFRQWSFQVVFLETANKPLLHFLSPVTTGIQRFLRSLQYLNLQRFLTKLFLISRKTHAIAFTLAKVKQRHNSPSTIWSYGRWSIDIHYVTWSYSCTRLASAIFLRLALKTADWTAISQVKNGGHRRGEKTRFSDFRLSTAEDWFVYSSLCIRPCSPLIHLNSSKEILRTYTDAETSVENYLSSFIAKY